MKKHAAKAAKAAEPAPAPAAYVGAPLFRIVVAVFAWTEKQAARLKQQVEDKFTGSEVLILDNTPPPPPVPEEAAVIAFPTPAAPPAADAAAAPTPEPPAEPEIETPATPPPPAPVAIGQKLRDLHTGATVEVVDIDPTGFAWKNPDPEAPTNARTGVCSFEILPGCFEILPDVTGQPSDVEKPGAASSPAAPGAGEKKPAAPKPKKPRAKKPAAAADSHAAHQPAKRAKKPAKAAHSHTGKH